MLVAASHAVEGHVARGFEAVRDAFADNFARRGELGGACCAYHRGDKVVDAYSVFATGGRELGLRPETLELLAAPAMPSTKGFYDECLKGDGVQFSLGFMKSSAVWRFGSPSSFGSPGSGGSLGFADPAVAVGYAYVTSQMGTTLTGDPREVALRDALYSALRKS
jgi:hypothetical protein